MEQEYQDSLDAHEDAEDVLSWEVSFLWQATRSDQSEGPTETKQKRENNSNEKMLGYDWFYVGVFGTYNGGPSWVHTQGDHDDNEHDPIEGID